MTREEKEKRHGDGAIGYMSIDTFSWPFRGPRGERVGAVLSTGRGVRSVAAVSKSAAAEAARGEIKHLMLRKSKGIQSFECIRCTPCENRPRTNALLLFLAAKADLREESGRGVDTICTLG